jgi:hypothetical protein
MTRPWWGGFSKAPLRALTILWIAGCCCGANLEIDVEYLGDNMALMGPSYDVGLSGIAALGGECSARAGLAHWRTNFPANGLGKFATDIATVEAEYRFGAIPVSCGMLVRAGASNLAREPHYFIGGEVPLKVSPAALPGVRFLASGGIRYGYADDNPFLAAMGAKKLSAACKAGVGVQAWEFHADYGYGRFDRIEPGQYKPFLDDTVFFSVLYDTLNPVLNLIDVRTDPFPANEEHRFALYLFGPALPFLYTGASFTYRNMTENYYLPIADDDGRIFFTYFPYYTPRNEGSFGLICAAVHATDDVAAFCNKAELKIHFPVYSFGSYRGYYQAAPGNVLAGFKDFFYDYYGTGGMNVAAEIQKRFPLGFRVGLHYSWNTRPYVAYRFFGGDSYQYHTLRLSISKGF